MIDPSERRRSEGRFGGLWQFGGFRGVGTRDCSARASLRGERGCASEPGSRVRGSVMLCRSEVSTFLTFGLFEHFGPNFENYFQGSFLVLVHIVGSVLTVAPTH